MGRGRGRRLKGKIKQEGGRSFFSPVNDVALKFTYFQRINFKQNSRIVFKKQQLITSEMMSVNASSLIFYLNAKFLVLSFIVPASCAKPTSDNMEPNATILNIHLAVRVRRKFNMDQIMVFIAYKKMSSRILPLLIFNCSKPIHLR